jgi:arylsulfatase A-like enzyme
MVFNSVRNLSSLVLCLSLLLSACSEEEPGVTDPVRNVILICADTVRFDTFFELFHDDALQPYLGDALRFDAAMSTAPWTVPSVATVMTGLYPRQHGAGRLSGEVVNLMAQIPSSLDSEVPTLAEQLVSQDFATAAFVAHPWFEAGYGLERGFMFLDSRKGWQMLNNLLFQWLDSDKLDGRRFFGYLHYMEAHEFQSSQGFSQTELIGEAPRETIDQILSQAPEPACMDHESTMCQHYQAYALRVAQLRGALADLLSRLEQQGLLEDTLVVFYSDHGEEFHDHQQELAAIAEDPRGVFGFGHGQSLYQELIHVPFLVWHPRRTGRRISRPTSLVDTTPSILHWMGIEPDLKPLSGMPLEFVLTKSSELAYARMLETFRPGPDQEYRPIFASGIGYGKERVSVLMGSEKAVYTPHLDALDFFDLAADPLEKSPAGADHLFYSHEPRIGDYLDLEPPTESETPEITQDRLEKLKSVGYLQGVDEPKKKSQ